jgi:hypothetical protein
MNKTTKLSQLQRQIIALAYVNHVSEHHELFNRCPHPDLYPAEVLIKHYGLKAKMRMPGADKRNGHRPYLQSWLDQHGIKDSKPDGVYWTETQRIRSNTYIANGGEYHAATFPKEPVGFYWRDWERQLALALYGYVWGWGSPVLDTDDPAYNKAHASLYRAAKRLDQRGLVVYDRIKTVDVTGLWLTPVALDYVADQLEPYRQAVA